MFLRSSLGVLAALLALGLPASAQTRTVMAGDIAVVEPWSRATPGSAKVGAGYLVIENRGTAPDRLVGGSLAVAGRVEIHEMSVTDGVMRMKPLENGLAVPPGGRVELKPGGLHAMFVDLKEPLREGQTIAGTLQFERAGTVAVEYRVGGIAAQGPGAHHHH